MARDKKYTRFLPGERVDQPDLQHAASTAILDAVTSLTELLLGGVEESYVISGFLVSNPSGTIVRITRDSTGSGAAMVAYRAPEGVKYGLLVTGGEAQRDVDISSFADGTYGIYIRGQLKDDAYQTRAFWEQNTASEIVQGMAVRYTEDWEYIISSLNPGDSWMQIGTVAKAGASLTMDSTLRRFFFEGLGGASAYNPALDWGTTADRDNNRAANGIANFRTFVRAMQAKVQDIYGGTPTNYWWKSIADRSIQDLTTVFSAKLARDGSQSMQGNLSPDGNGTRSLGATSFRWLRGWFSDLVTSTLNIGEALLSTDSDRAIPRLISYRPTPGGARVREMRRVRAAGATGVDTSEVWICSGSVNLGTPSTNYPDATLHCYNCESLATWSRYASGGAYIIVHSRVGVAVYSFDATVTSSWADGDWVLLSRTNGAGTTLSGATSLTGGLSVAGTATMADAVVPGNVLATTADFTGALDTTTTKDAIPSISGRYAQNNLIAFGTIAVDNTGTVISSTGLNYTVANPGAAQPVLVITLKTDAISNRYTVVFTPKNQHIDGGVRRTPVYFNTSTAVGTLNVQLMVPGDADYRDWDDVDTSITFSFAVLGG